VTDDYDAVVYDLDGTLARLNVDWEQVERDVSARLRAANVDPDNFDTWGLLEAAEDAGIGEEVDEIIADHERDGATRAERLPCADELGVEPENTLFVGDSPSDETTANRAGTAFRRV